MFSMYGAVILIFVFVTVSADIKYDMDLCQEYQGFLVPCCEDDYPATPPMTGKKPPDMSECNSLLSGCERELCRAKKMGFIDNDDKIDRAKVVDAMFKKVADDPGLMAEVKSKCINGDFESYAPTNTCVFQKISRCVLMQWLKRCTKWGENETCHTFKGLIKECVKAFHKIRELISVQKL